LDITICLPLAKISAMNTITIVVPEGDGNNLSSIIGAFKVLTRANEHWRSRGKKVPFQIQVAGISKKVLYFDGLFSVKPHLRLDAVRSPQLIIIPSLNHDYVNAVKKNKTLIDWIREQYKAGSAVAAICTGAFLLASSGLLDGRTCSTHWAAADTFRKMFPNVDLQPDKLITDEKGIYTNGGAYSFLNLVLYLIEKYYDRTTAIYCAKVFQIEPDRNSQSPFIIFSGQKMHGDEVVKKAQVYLESKPHEKISIEHLSSRFAVGRRNFDRRFIKATGSTPLEYSQRVKIESAKQAFERSRKTISEVMYDVGYSDMKAFREVFRKFTGMSPLEYRNKYNREATV
jgi:transcriptional regulator GlxA family with amidase domain